MDLGYIRLPACKSQQELDKGIAHLEQAGNLPKSSISLDRSDGKNPDREELQDVLRALHPGNRSLFPLACVFFQEDSRPLSLWSTDAQKHFQGQHLNMLF